MKYKYETRCYESVQINAPENRIIRDMKGEKGWELVSVIVSKGTIIEYYKKSFKTLLPT